jgi:hypothetical protein
MRREPELYTDEENVDMAQVEETPISGSEKLAQVAPELPSEPEMMPAERDQATIDRTFRERVKGRLQLENEERALAAQGSSQIEQDAPLARGILAAQRGFANLLSKPEAATAGIQGAESSINEMVQGEQMRRKGLREQLESRRKRLDEPLADLSLKSRLLGEARKERVGAATEGDEITKSGQEVKKGQQGLELGELNKTRMGQDITEGARKIGDEEQKREGASERSQTARTIISEGLRKEAAALRASGQRDLAARAETEANRIGGSELSEFDLEKYPIAGMSGKDFLADQRSREAASLSLSFKEKEAARKSERGDETEGRFQIGQYEKRAKDIREMESNIAQTRNMFEIAKKNPEAVGILQYNIARTVAGEKGPLSNQDVQRAGLGSVAAFDQLLQIAASKGFGALTDGQKKTLENLLTLAEQRAKEKATKLNEETIRRAEKKGIDVEYITGKTKDELIPSETPKTQAAPYGQRVERNGTMYIWNGSKYVREAK